MAIMLCAPLLMVCVAMLISMTREASNLLVDVKRMKIDTQTKQKQKNENKEKKDEKKRRKKGQKKDWFEMEDTVSLVSRGLIVDIMKSIENNPLIGQ